MLRALLVLLLAACAFPQDQWTIVIAGDGRWRNGNPREEDRDGVNAKILQEVVAATLKEHAAAFLFTGDLVGGYNEPSKFEAQLRAWMAFVKPLLDAGVRVLPVRGNHEIGDAADGFEPHRTQLYRDIVAKGCKVPENGPVGEELLTYSLAVGNTLLVGLDQFKVGRTAVNLPWFEKELKATQAAHVIPYAHEMAFTAGSHRDHMGDAANADARDKFWQLLMRHKVAWFFAGHDHLYDRMKVEPVKATDASFPVEQIVAGTTGAPPYPSTAYFPGTKENPEPGAGMWKATQEFHVGGTFGYVVVRIEGSKATMTYKARTLDGNYVAIDEWGYSR